MRGFQVYEFLLDDNARGRGLAPVAMQLLCDVLPAQTGDTLWGDGARGQWAVDRQCARCRPREDGGICVGAETGRAVARGRGAGQ